MIGGLLGQDLNFWRLMLSLTKLAILGILESSSSDSSAAAVIR